MKRRTSVFEIFQDPLLTIVALILLGTLWILIPKGSSESPKGPEPTPTQHSNAELRQVIAQIEKRIKELQVEIQRIQVELRALEALEKEAEKAEKRAKDLSQLQQRIVTLQTLLQQKRKELEELEKQFEAAQKRADEAKRVKELEQRIQESRRELTQKEKALIDLAKLKDREQQAQRQQAQEQRARMREIQGQVEQERRQIAELEKRKQEIDGEIKAGGTAPYSEDLIKGKEPVAFEVVNNRLVKIDKEHHDVEVFYTMSDGRRVPVAKLTRKQSAAGESVEEIAASSSAFQTTLSDLDSNTHYLVFAVRDDSFQAFLEARRIARQRHFVTSWQPMKDGPIYVGSGGETWGGRR